ncbi:MAG: DUF2892 domain-containing protein [Bdellovibrionaceae bacterium]|nr:DUF2892 domain-containing protein [Pseudobdellovibrionaceae bacterium]
MKRNIVWWDRFSRFIIGSVSCWAWGFSPVGPAWAYLGIYFLGTGSWGYCPVYSLINYQPFEED